MDNSISSSIILEKNELMYLMNYVTSDIQNVNIALLAEYTGISEPDNRKAITGLMQKNIIYFVDNKIVTVKLFDFYIKKMISTENIEIIGDERKKLVFDNHGIVFLIKEHNLSENHISIRAFRTKKELLESLTDTEEEQ